MVQRAEIWISNISLLKVLFSSCPCGATSWRVQLLTERLMVQINLGTIICDHFLNKETTFLNDIKKALKRCNLDIRLIQRPQSTLKSLLVESRPYDKTCKETAKCNVCRNSPATPKTHCSQKDIVYSIKCDLYQDDDSIYIGETSRPLALRFQEHYRSAANPNAKSYKNMAFSKHYKACHEGQKPKLTAKILRKTSGSLERKVTEAVLIQKLKPDLNGQVNIVDFVI